jgi:hypothetical protein
MPAIATIVARVLFYIVQVVFWVLFVKTIDTTYNKMKTWHVARTAAKAA